MTDCIVVGGGLIGMLTARFLHEAGASVKILDRGRLGHESSWAGGGILSPLYPWKYRDSVNRLAQLGQMQYPDFATALFEETGIDPEWTRSGMLVMDESEFSQAKAWCQKSSARCEELTRTDLRDSEPILSEALHAALHFPEVAQIRNPRLVKALRASLDLRGIRYREGVEVTGLFAKTGRIRGVRTATGMLSAQAVVVAGGAWSAKLWSQVDTLTETRAASPLPIEPVQGQMIVFKASPYMLRHIILYEGQYLIPRRDGHILVGSTLEDVGFNKHTTKAALDTLRKTAEYLAPTLSSLPVVHQWAGLRPGSPDNIPRICEHPEIDGLFINAGHFRYGVLMGLPSARLCADQVLGREPSIDAGDYALSRALSRN